MRGHLLSIPAIGRVAGFALVAAAIIAAALQFHARAPRVQTRHANPTAATDALTAELKRCELLSEQAKDDPACEAAWAANRRRFFTYGPAGTPARPSQPKPSGR